MEQPTAAPQLQPIPHFDEKGQEKITSLVHRIATASPDRSGELGRVICMEVFGLVRSVPGGHVKYSDVRCKGPLFEWTRRLFSQYATATNFPTDAMGLCRDDVFLDQVWTPLAEHLDHWIADLGTPAPSQPAWRLSVRPPTSHPLHIPRPVAAHRLANLVTSAGAPSAQLAGPRTLLHPALSALPPLAPGEPPRPRPVVITNLDKVSPCPLSSMSFEDIVKLFDAFGFEPYKTRHALQIDLRNDRIHVYFPTRTHTLNWLRGKALKLRNTPVSVNWTEDLRSLTAEQQAAQREARLRRHFPGATYPAHAPATEGNSESKDSGSPRQRAATPGTPPPTHTPTLTPGPIAALDATPLPLQEGNGPVNAPDPTPTPPPEGNGRRPELGGTPPDASAAETLSPQRDPKKSRLSSMVPGTDVTMEEAGGDL
jgi:hypothetical protein